MFDIEHPAITRAILTGYPDGEPKYPTCPCCGKECEKIYRDKDKYVLGCDNCVNAVDAWEWQNEGDADCE